MRGKEWFHASTKAAQTAQELHIIQVYKDPEFQADVESKVQNPAKLADKYCISESDIELYIGGLRADDRIKRSLLPFDIEPDGSGHWQAWINGDISKEDFMEMWAEISRFKTRKHGKTLRQRPPDNPPLIYAIFKQRQKSPPTSFGAITKMYKNGELPHYNGDIKKSITIQNLTREYNRYNPKNYI